MQIKTTRNITAQQIADLMVTCIEGNHMTRSWCNGIYLAGKLSDKEEELKGDCVWYSQASLYEREDFAIIVEEVIDESKEPEGDNIKKHTLYLKSFKAAFELMARDYADSFNAFIEGDYYIYTADTFLQLAVLGDVIYG